MTTTTITKKPAVRKTIRTGDEVFLSQLDGSVREFTIYLRNTDPAARSSLLAHLDICAKVRVVAQPSGFAIWLGELCIHEDVKAEKRADGSFLIRV